jgi:hypothetical protein
MNRYVLHYRHRIIIWQSAERLPAGNQGLILGYCVIIDEEVEEGDDHDDEK